MNRPASNQFSLSALIVLVTFAALFFGIGVAVGFRMVMLVMLPVFGIAALLRAFCAEFMIPINDKPALIFVPKKNEALWYILIAMVIWLPCFVAVIIFVNGWAK